MTTHKHTHTNTTHKHNTHTHPHTYKYTCTTYLFVYQSKHSAQNANASITNLPTYAEFCIIVALHFYSYYHCMMTKIDKYHLLSPCSCVITKLLQHIAIHICLL